MHPAVPLVSIILYWFLSTPLFTWVRKTFKVESKGTTMQLMTTTHSLILAIYSIFTCYHSFSLFLLYASKHGIYTALCDVKGDLWNEHKLGYWITHFYISKYCEFIDTWTFHHAGIVIIAWSLVVTQNSSGGSILILLNSFIHSLMYSYFVFASMGIHSPFKKYLTMAQITQFIVGIIITIPTYWYINEAQVFTLAGIHIYTIALLYLFYNFFQSSYSSRKSSIQSTKGE